MAASSSEPERTAAAMSEGDEATSVPPNALLGGDAGIQRLVELASTGPPDVAHRLLPTFATLLGIPEARGEAMLALRYVLSSPSVASRFVGDDEASGFCRAAADALAEQDNGTDKLSLLAAMCRAASPMGLDSIAAAPGLGSSVADGLAGNGAPNGQVAAVEVCAELAKAAPFRKACAEHGIIDKLTPLLSVSPRAAEALRRVAASDASLATHVAVHARRLIDIATHRDVRAAVRTCALAALAACLAEGARAACTNATAAVPDLAMTLLGLVKNEAVGVDDNDSDEYETDEEDEEDEEAALVGLRAAAVRALGSLAHHSEAVTETMVHAAFPHAVSLMDDDEYNIREVAAGAFFCECVARARGELLAMHDSAPRMTEYLLRAMAAAGRELDPDDVNATAAAAESAVRALFLVTNHTSVASSVVEYAALAAEALGTLLDECSYVRLRRLFPGLAHVEAAAAASLTGPAELQAPAPAPADSGEDLESQDSFDSSMDFHGDVVRISDDVRMLCAQLISKVATRLPDGCLTRKSGVLAGLGALLRGSGTTAEELGRARTAACVALWTLAESGPTNRRLIVRFSNKHRDNCILASLVETLHGPGAIATIAAGAVGALAQDVAVRSAVGATPRVVASLISLLQNASERFPRARILSALASLSLDSAVSARIAATPGALALLLACFQKVKPVSDAPLPAEEAHVPAYAIATLGNLAGHHASQPTVAGMAATLSNALFAILIEPGRSADASFRSTTLSALRNLALIPAARSEICALPNIIDTLMALCADIYNDETSEEALAGLWLNLMSDPSPSLASVLKAKGAEVARCLTARLFHAQEHNSDDDSAALRRRYYAMTLAAVMRYDGARHAAASIEDLRSAVAVCLRDDASRTAARDEILVASSLEVARRVLADPLCPALARHHWIESVAGDEACLARIVALLPAASDDGGSRIDEVAAMAAGLLVSIIRILAAEKNSLLVTLGPEPRHALVASLGRVLGSPAADAAPNPSAAACAASALRELATVPSHGLRLALSEACFDRLHACACRADGPAASCASLVLFRLSCDPCVLTEEQLSQLGSTSLVEAAARVLPLTHGGDAKAVRRCFDKDAPWLNECGVFDSPTVPWSADASLVIQRAASTVRDAEELRKCLRGSLASRVVACLTENRISKSGSSPSAVAANEGREAFRADAHAMAACAAAALASNPTLAAQLCARADDLLPSLCAGDGTPDAVHGCLSCLANLCCHDGCLAALGAYIDPWIKSSLQKGMVHEDEETRRLAFGAARNLVLVDSRIWCEDDIRASVFTAVKNAVSAQPAPGDDGRGAASAAIAQYAVEIVGNAATLGGELPELAESIPLICACLNSDALEYYALKTLVNLVRANPDLTATASSCVSSETLSRMEANGDAAERSAAAWLKKLFL